MAALVYSNGVSIVHFTLFVSWFFVSKPNFELAEEIESADPRSLLFPQRANIKTPNEIIRCSGLAEELNYTLGLCLACHLLCTFSCFAKEIYETKLGTFGQAMRAIEIFSIIFNIFQLILCLTMLAKYFAFA